MAIHPPLCETLTVEFKSDHRKLPDKDLVEALICLANAEGGELWLGVEDDGTPSGLHPDHYHLKSMIDLIAANTTPSLKVQAELIDVSSVPVARFEVPRATHGVITSSGVYLVRRLKHDGTPECVNMPAPGSSGWSR